MLDKAVHSLDLPELCPPGPPKTSPLGQEALGSREAPATGSCPPLGRRSRRSSSRDSLHSFNPAFRLAAPSPALGRSASAVGHAPQSDHAPQVNFVPAVNFTPGIDFIPLAWVTEDRGIRNTWKFCSRSRVKWSWITGGAWPESLYFYYVCVFDYMCACLGQSQYSLLGSTILKYFFKEPSYDAST